jgi:hypothetical protein
LRRLRNACKNAFNDRRGTQRAAARGAVLYRQPDWQKAGVTGGTVLVERDAAGRLTLAGKD